MVLLSKARKSLMVAAELVDQALKTEAINKAIQI
jgi:hypothetical protein